MPRLTYVITHALLSYIILLRVIVVVVVVVVFVVCLRRPARLFTWQGQGHDLGPIPCCAC